MPKKRLTDLFCERAKPLRGEDRSAFFDAAYPGLVLRVTRNGAKSFAYYYRFKGRLRLLTLGKYPAMKPADARLKAIEAHEKATRPAEQAIDPAEEKRAERRAQREQRDTGDDTFGALAELYLERHVAKNNAPSTYAEAKRDLARNVLPKWRRRPIASMTDRDVIDLVDGIAARGADSQARHTFVRLRALFNWAVRERRRLKVSPMQGLKAPGKERERDRVLTDDELRWFWKGCERLGWPFGPLFQLLLLCAQRRDECASMELSEIDLDKRMWTIPPERMKRDLQQQVHLSEATLAVLRPVLARKRPSKRLVFTTTGETSVSGFSRAKGRLAAWMLKAKREELGARKAGEIPQWTLHDLRRTAATAMARLRIAPHVIDRILAHKEGTIRGVARIYNRFEYLEERRDALEAWGRYIDHLVAPAPASNVTELRSRTLRRKS
jgi:integrase